MSAQTTHHVSYTLFLNCIRNKQTNKANKQNQPNKKKTSRQKAFCAYLMETLAMPTLTSVEQAFHPPLAHSPKALMGASLLFVPDLPASLRASWGAWRCPQPCQGPCPFFTAWAAAPVQGPAHQAPSRRSTDVLQMCRGSRC